MRQFSLRNFLVIPFLVLFLLAVGIIGGTGYRSGMQSVETFERQMADEISARISAHLNYYFSSAVLLAYSTVEAINSGLIDPKKPEDMQRYLVGKMRSQSYLTFISLGYADGQFIGATRLLDSNEIRLMTAQKQEGMTVDTYAVNNNNTRGALISHGPQYDARTRNWFTQAESSGKLSWYPVYKYSALESLGIGASVPVYDKNSKKLIGVTAVDVALTQIGRYLQSQPISKSGLSFIIEPSGELIASSLKAPVFHVDGDRVQRLTLDNHFDIRIRQAGAWIKANKAQAGQDFINIEGERYLIDLMDFRDQHGLHFLVGVLLPEHDFSESLIANLKRTAWIILAISILGGLLSIVLAKWLAQPINDMNEQATRLASREWSEHSVADSQTSVREINTLARNFNKMAAQLRNAFYSLEERVAERTRELEAANNELARIATQDGLTHIANRRHFDDFLQQEWGRCLRQKQPLSLLMLDVDHFKAFNDTYGHPAGDQALIEVAAVCEANTERSSDLAARYGGEEFAIILTNTDTAGAMKIAEDVLLATRSLAIPHKESPAAEVLTISIGVATFSPSFDTTPEELIKAADTALYIAKDSGRNQVCNG